MGKRITFLLLVSVIAFKAGAWEPVKQTVNAYIGDKSYVELYGKAPETNVNYKQRIIIHLAYVEELLSLKDVAHLSEDQRTKRNCIIEHLKKYRIAEVFPANYDYPDELKPCFIDRNGRICAVGYLIEQTAGRALAEEINSTYQYEYVMNIESEKLEKWIEKNGLTREECAMIQPSYTIPEEKEEEPAEPVDKFVPDTSKEEMVYDVYQVDVAPHFNEGDAKMTKYMSDSIILKTSMAECGESGRVLVSFEVDTLGNLTNVKAIKSFGCGADEEIVRVVKSMSGKWEPAQIKGQAVRCKFILPVQIQFRS